MLINKYFELMRLAYSTLKIFLTQFILKILIFEGKDDPFL